MDDFLPFPQVSTVALDAKDEMDDVEDIVEILEQIGFDIIIAKEPLCARRIDRTTGKSLNVSAALSMINSAAAAD